MLVPVDAAQTPERSPHERLGLAPAAGLHQQTAQGQGGAQGVGMIRAQFATSDGQGRLQVDVRIFETPQAAQGHADRLAGGGLQLRLSGEGLFHLRAGQARHFGDGRVAFQAARRRESHRLVGGKRRELARLHRVRAGEGILEEAANGLSTCCLRGRRVTLAPGLHESAGRHRQTTQQRQDDEGAGDNGALVAAHELAQAVCRPGRSGQDGLVVQVAPDVIGQTRGRFVAAGAVLFERLHDDPVQVAPHQPTQRARFGLAGGGHVGQLLAQRAQPLRGSLGVLLTDDALEVPEGRDTQLPGVERRGTREQLVEQHAQRIHVGAGVDVEPADLGLLGAHVLGRPDELAKLGEQGQLGQPRAGRLRDTEVNDLRHELPVLTGDEHVGGLEVAMNDALLVGVLHGAADLREELQPRPGREALAVAVFGDGNAAHELHDEVRPAVVGRPGIQHPGDVGVVHHRQGLPLGLEAGDHLLRVHAELDDFQGDLATDRFFLLGPVNGAEPAFADELQQPIGPDALSDQPLVGLVQHFRPIQSGYNPIVIMRDKRIDFGAHLPITPIVRVKISPPLVGSQLRHLVEEPLRPAASNVAHSWLPGRTEPGSRIGRHG